MSKKYLRILSLLVLVSVLLTACQEEPVVRTVEVTRIIRETVPVPVETVVEKIVEVEKTVEVQKKAFTTPHPILADIRVRQAIAYCTNRLELIRSVYPWLPADQLPDLLMDDTPFPKKHWNSYDGPDLQKYPYDPEKGKALLEEAGWTLKRGNVYRTNANGDTLSLKLTTTTAEYRQIWAAVFEANMADCGIQIVRLHVPASWWLGATTGLRRRDFELGAYTWASRPDPKDQARYACDQVPNPGNGWIGQNSMGWCNQIASDAINAANNTLIREERMAFYRTFQIEFARDMVSLPLFQRAEWNAINKDLRNFKPSATEYYTWNSYEWELPGRDTLVIALSQEPNTMLTLVSQMAVQRNIAWLVFDSPASQVDYDYQPAAQKQLATVESGLTRIVEVEVKEGDPVVDANGTPVDAEGDPLTLKKGLKVKDASGSVVEFESGTVKMKQLISTYKWNEGLKWSDGQPVIKADFELAYQHDCDPKSGAADDTICQSIQSVEFTSDTEYTVTYKPGYLTPLSMIAPIYIYPSHLVLTAGKYKGQTLDQIPAEEWTEVPEIAETPLGIGPYILRSWQKGIKMELEANPYYWRGEPQIKKITVLIVADAQQAVAKLLNGNVDIVGPEILGSSPEVEKVFKAQSEGKVRVVMVPGATWEHIDMNLWLP